MLINKHSPGEMKYHDFSTRDFILDEGFQAWVLEPDTVSDAFWQDWLTTYPEKLPKINKAKAAILELQQAGIRKEQFVAQPTPILQPEISPAEIQAIWQNITKAIQTPQITATAGELPSEDKIIAFNLFGSWAKIAASIVLFISIGGLLLWLKQAPARKPAAIVYTTNFGETRQITLPDSSVVFLNANSKLTIYQVSDKEADREATLTGEAFFSVVHTQNKQKFKVNLSKRAQVEVLGTEFTVTNRPNLARVVLNRGKVKVALAKPSPAASTNYSAAAEIMSPGDLVQIDQLHQKLNKQKVVHPEKYAAFTHNLLEFNDAPLAEVAQVLHDNYGYKVTFAPKSLAAKRFTSSSPADRIDLLLFAIEKAFSLKITQKGKHITMQKIS